MTSLQSINNGIATYKDIEFIALSIKLTGGRSTVLHQFYGKNFSSLEDTGRIARKFDVEGIIIGDDHDQKREQLVIALEKNNVGVLYYPLFGNVNVRLFGTYSIVESPSHQRTTKFTATFVEDLSVRAQSVQQKIDINLSDDIQSEIIASAESLDSVISAEVSDRFVTSGQIQSIIDQAIETINNSVTQLRKIYGQIKSFIGTVARVSEAIENFAKIAESLISTPLALIGEIQGIFNAIISGIDAVLTAVIDTTSAVASLPAIVNRNVVRLAKKIYLRMMSLGELLSPFSDKQQYTSSFGFSRQVATGNGQNFETANQNIEQIETAIRCSIVKSICLGVVGIDFYSAEDVFEIRRPLTSLIDETLQNLGDESYRTMCALKASTIAYFVSLERSLPRLKTYKTNEVTTSLYLSHLLYGDIAFEQDLVESNNIPNPAFIPAHTEIRYVGISE